MKYGLLQYRTGNIGDEIQSLAAKQFLPEIDMYLERDYLNQIDTDDEIKLILNGWFTHHPENWPPADNIDPLITSFHLSRSARDGLLRPKSIEYFKKHEPIGCRDLYTKRQLTDKGVDAYFSGCLTLTLNSEKEQESSGEIIFVDLDEEVISGLPSDLVREARRKTHNYQDSATNLKSNIYSNTPERIKQVSRRTGLNSAFFDVFERFISQTSGGHTNRETKFTRAQHYLKEYAKAELVITSRLHVTLPCLAFGTPVILIHEDPDDPRFSGLDEYMNIVPRHEIINSGKDIDYGMVQNPKSIKSVRTDLIDTANNFI